MGTLRPKKALSLKVRTMDNEAIELLKQLIERQQTIERILTNKLKRDSVPEQTGGISIPKLDIYDQYLTDPKGGSRMSAKRTNRRANLDLIVMDKSDGEPGKVESHAKNVRAIFAIVGYADGTQTAITNGVQDDVIPLLVFAKSAIKQCAQEIRKVVDNTDKL